MEISLVGYFCHGSRIKFDLNFNDYSRCKLPLDNSNSSKLNIVSKIKGKFDSFCEQKQIRITFLLSNRNHSKTGVLDHRYYSEDYISSDQFKFQKIIPNARINIKFKERIETVIYLTS